MEKCGEGVVDAVSDVVVLGFDLADGVLEKSPQLLVELVQSGAFQSSIQKALAAEGKRLAELQQSDKPIANKDGAKVLTAIRKAAASTSQLSVNKKIEKSSDYRALEKSLKNVECTFKESPVGVFIDENENLLLIVASGLAISGAVAMYATKSGDWAGAQLASFATKKLRYKFLGKVEIGAKKLEFKPSKRLVKLTTFSTVKWKSVKTSLDLNVKYEDSKLTEASASGEVVASVTRQTDIIGKGSVGYVRAANPGELDLTYTLGLGMSFTGSGQKSKLKLQVLGYVNQAPTARSVGGSSTLTYGLTGGGGGTPGVNLTLGAKGARTETFLPSGGSESKTAVETKLGLEFNF